MPRTPDHDARYVEVRQREVPVAPDRAWAAVRRAAGVGTGLTALAWSVRNTVDGLVGGPARAWEVVTEEAPQRLALEAVARLPGRATLELTVEPTRGGRWALITQTNTFDPDGLVGRAYWHALGPAHRVVFARMLRDVARLAERS